MVAEAVTYPGLEAVMAESGQGWQSWSIRKGFLNCTVHTVPVDFRVGLHSTARRQGHTTMLPLDAPSQPCYSELDVPEIPFPPDPNDPRDQHPPWAPLDACRGD